MFQKYTTFLRSDVLRDILVEQLKARQSSLLAPQSLCSHDLFNSLYLLQFVKWSKMILFPSVLPLPFPFASNDRYILSYLFGVMAMLGKSKLLRVGVLGEPPTLKNFLLLYTVVVIQYLSRARNYGNLSYSSMLHLTTLYNNSNKGSPGYSTRKPHIAKVLLLVASFIS